MDYAIQTATKIQKAKNNHSLGEKMTQNILFGRIKPLIEVPIK